MTIADDTYRAVMMTEPPESPTPLDAAEFEHTFGTIWNRPNLSVRERRFVSLVCVSWAVDIPAIDAHVYAALKSGDFTIEQLNEFTLHFAVYCGWPKASQVEMTVRTQWQRLHGERGEPAPAFPQLQLDDLGPGDAAQRVRAGMQSFEAINLVPPPPQDSPYFFAGILNFVFGHVWLRPGLTRRERRLITIACVGVEESPMPIWSHVTSALGSGDLSPLEMHEVIEHFSAYADATRASALNDSARQWQADNP